MRAAKLMEMAQDLRRRAAEVTQMDDYARKMLEAAAELERQAQLERAARQAQSGKEPSV